MPTFQLIREWTTEAGLPAMMVHAEHKPEVKKIMDEVEAEMRQRWGPDFVDKFPIKEQARDWYNGYVGVTENHPLHGHDAAEQNPLLQPPEGSMGARGILNLIFLPGDSPANAFDVHGGVTVAASSENFDFADQITPGIWWFGFDCNHAMDHPDNQDEIYVRQECERLATQIAVLQPKET